jgi:flagellar basal body-associated protein FliL
MGKKKTLKKSLKKKNKVLYLIAGLLVAIFIFSAGTMMLMVSEEMEEPGPPPEPQKEPHLMVEDVFFMKTLGYRASNEWTDITTTVYITNDGMADARNVKITAFPIDKNKNLALDKRDTVVGSIPAQETKEVEFIITVPGGTRHDVNLLIFESNKLILRGSGSVVIQGDYTNVPKYQTEEIHGTRNDTDYDGMADSWEQYYGLDPTNPNDAKRDDDKDGLSNLAEYLAGSKPKEPAEKEEKGADGTGAMGDNTSIIGLVVFIIIIIIIVILVAAVGKSSEGHKKAAHIYTTKEFWSGQQSNNNGSSNGYTYPNWQKPLARCVKCGGWVVNDSCTNCSAKYPAVPQANNGSTNNSDSDIE